MIDDIAWQVLLAESDRRDREQQRLLNNWHQGWQACSLALDDAYERGFLDGLLTRRRFQREAVNEVRNDATMWGAAGREHFADPRPGDYRGGPVAW